MTHPLFDQYSRQRRLPEVGVSGQARVEALDLTTGVGSAALTELTYLERAGVQRVSLSRLSEGAIFPHANAFHSPATRELAAGAWRALTALRSALTSKDTR